MKVIDLRSDTVTKPTNNMRKAAMEAEVGDDVFGDDPSVNELEKYAAELLGMDAALFVSSGTQGNLVSILAQTQPGDEILLESQSHIYYYEVGGLSAVGGCSPQLFESDRGYLPSAQLVNYFRSDDIHYPNTSLLCLENTHNRHGGAALTPAQIREMASTAKERNLRVHLDGARIFNAVVVNNCEARDYTRHVDSIQTCLSKGLSAPVGSIVAGDQDFVNRARKKRKMLGGGMRQAGIIAAPGLIALKEMRERLAEDHGKAKQLASGLKDLGLNVWDPDTNIVVCDISDLFSHSSEAIELLEKNNILSVPFGDKLVRLTTHRHITSENISKVIEVVEKVWS